MLVPDQNVIRLIYAGNIKNTCFANDQLHINASVYR